MNATPLPTGVRLDPLLDAIVAWDAASAAMDRRRAVDVGRQIGLDGAVETQVEFLEAIGILESVGDVLRLTDDGESLARSLAAGDHDRARDLARDLFWEFPLTEELRGILRENPLPREMLAAHVAVAAGRNPGRASADASTLLDLYEWADVLDRDETGRYRLSDVRIPIPDGSMGPSGAPGGGQGPPSSGMSTTPQQGVSRRGPSQSAQQQPGGQQQQAPPGQMGQQQGPAGQQAPDAGGAPGETPQTHEHALSVKLSVDSLELDVDADASKLEQIVKALRRGLLPDDGMNGGG